MTKSHINQSFFSESCEMSTQSEEAAKSELNNRSHHININYIKWLWLSVMVFVCLFSNKTIVNAANNSVYYDPTIKNIIIQDCSRCHSGPSRNLMDYDNLKMYADSGMLAAMVQGPMGQFAGNDASTILDWINNGSPEKPAGGTMVRFQSGGNHINGIQNQMTGNSIRNHTGINPTGNQISNNPMTLAANAKVYYDPTIKDIINKDCARCHSGPSRNLMDYDNLKMYADSGMLAAMVQGSMSRFAGNDMGTILDWINSGSPEKQGAAPAGFFSTMNQPTGCPSNQMFVPDVPLDKITYTNTIQYVLARDCLGCHSDKFRNLTTYENVKIYVDNGLLRSLVQRGGPMHRFAGPDAKLIIMWVDKGAPR
ncbi:MAG: hypothetical protein HQK72_05470 [Desulfamplus sp.]|nr:hypothetical protein [Desulfamplus sp.]